MGILEIVLCVLLILMAAVLIVLVLKQSGQEKKLSGTIAGGAETFLSKNKARDWDSKLARMTKYIAIAFFVLAVVANIFALAAK